MLCNNVATRYSVRPGVSGGDQVIEGVYLHRMLDGWVELDNNIAEDALRGVAVGRKSGCSRVPAVSVNTRRRCTHCSAPTV